MDTIANILAQKDFTPPEEVKAIKAYVASTYGYEVSVKLAGNDIIITGRSAGLISTLRLNAPALAKAAGTKKQLRFKIG